MLSDSLVQISILIVIAHIRHVCFPIFSGKGWIDVIADLHVSQTPNFKIKYLYVWTYMYLCVLVYVICMNGMLCVLALKGSFLNEQTPFMDTE